MGSSWIFYLKIVVIVLLLYFWARGVTRLWRQARFKRMLKKSVIVSASTQKGDYVNFNGVLTIPATQLPISGKSCGYWVIVIRAIFKAKVKKPGKGVETHRPVIYRAEFDKIPLIISSKDQLVHVVMDRPSQFMANMQSEKLKSMVIPLHEAKPLAKAKYESFETDQYWLPEKAFVSLWATVVETNKNCISVSSGENPKIPALIFHGEKESVYNKLSIAIFVLLMLVIMAPMAIFFLVNMSVSETGAINMLIAEVSVLLAAYILYKTGRVNFVR